MVEDRYPLALPDLADKHCLVASQFGDLDRPLDLSFRHEDVVAHAAVEGREHVVVADAEDLVDVSEDRRLLGDPRPGMDVVGEGSLVIGELGNAVAGSW